MSIKLTVEFIRKEFEKEGYELLTNIYKNSGQKLKYVCPNGHQHSICWGDWNSKRKHRCPYCAGLAKLTVEFIRKEFEKEGYELLTNIYKNSGQKLKYVCPNGHKHSIIWSSWQQGIRCPYCVYISNSIRFSGKNNPAWKGGISCEPYCFEWSSKEFKDYIKERDNCKCLNPDCWRISQKLTIHHINYKKKDCKPRNLITLCNSCNARANFDRDWHQAWYEAIIYRRGLIYAYTIESRMKE